jgi:hypothetical protein
MTNISKEEILEKHLPYEIDMLRQTYRKLGEGQLPDDVIKKSTATASLARPVAT